MIGAEGREVTLHGGSSVTSTQQAQEVG
jgi:hypothetical protein